MNYAVIMAGGTGKRLWPLSRQDRPKQVLKLLDGRTLLELCFRRLTDIFDPVNIIVLTNARYVDIVRENLSALPPDNVIAEPAVRDTAGAIGLAAAVISKSDPDATMAVVTADQLIEPAEVLGQAISDALLFVNENPDDLITFGIKPAFASTQLGYIKCINAQKYAGCKNDIFTVEAFREKPDEKTAATYLNSGQYMWNSGMFVWKAKTILANLERFLPQSTESLAKIKTAWNTPKQQQVLKDWFPKLPKISIDYAVMEKAKSVHAIKLDCRWMDLGSFAALAEFVDSDENNNIVVAGQSRLLDCHNNIIVTEQKDHLIACLGLKEIVVAHTPDATLVCSVEQAYRLKELLELIEQQNGEKFL